jgi:hypothetical protein
MWRARHTRARTRRNDKAMTLLARLVPSRHAAETTAILTHSDDSSRSLTPSAPAD